MEHKDRREKATQKRREDGIHNGKRNKEQREVAFSPSFSLRQGERLSFFFFSIAIQYRPITWYWTKTAVFGRFCLISKWQHRSDFSLFYHVSGPTSLEMNEKKKQDIYFSFNQAAKLSNIRDEFTKYWTTWLMNFQPSQRLQIWINWMDHLHFCVFR